MSPGETVHRNTKAALVSFSMLNWITNLYGDGIEEPNLEADWLAVKSNRSVIMMLFDMEAEKFKSELYKEEEKIVGGEKWLK